MIRLFRNRLAQVCAVALVFERVQQQFWQHGYMVRCGWIVDASLVQAQAQRNKRKDADVPKDTNIPWDREAGMHVQKDVDVRWT